MTDWAKYPLEVMARGMVLNDEEVREMCAEIDAQDAKIKALVEYVESIADWMASNGYDNTSDLAFLAAVKETT